MRSRGGGRGGATATQPTIYATEPSETTTPPQGATSIIQAEAPAQPVIPKAEDDDDDDDDDDQSTTPGPVQSTPAVVESQASPTVTAS